MIIPVEKIQLHRHVITTEAVYLRELIAPLRLYAGITHFAYQKLYGDGSISFITTTPAATEIFLREKFYKLAFNGNIDRYRSCVLFGNTIENSSPILKAEAEHCGLAHHLCIIRKHIDHVEFFFFAAPIENKKVNNFYINHLDFLNHFIDFFKCHAKSIIKKFEEQRVLIPDTTNITNKKKSPEDKRQFTEKENELSTYLIGGLSAKQIAQQLAISHRTVEKHVANMKEKSRCTNVKELIHALSRYHFT